MGMTDVKISTTVITMEIKTINIIFTFNTISDRNMKLKGIKNILLSLVDQKVNIYSVRQELLDFLNNDLYKNDGEILSYKESIMLFCAV